MATTSYQSLLTSVHYLFLPSKADMSPQTINVGVGERYQLLVPLTQTPNDYTIRVSTNILLQYINSYAVSH